eukprot:m.119386 g.119386  ORF g.119386 m.119386 type:complete len:83 (+) comp15588_c0_seq3:149-397(+)
MTSEAFRPPFTLARSNYKHNTLTLSRVEKESIYLEGLLMSRPSSFEQQLLFLGTGFRSASSQLSCKSIVLKIDQNGISWYSI